MQFQKLCFPIINTICGICVKNLYENSIIFFLQRLELG